MTPTLHADQNSILAAIDQVLQRCMASQAASPDPTVESEGVALQRIRMAVQQQWPLPDEAKKLIMIGPVAAKNIQDWNPGLADGLMVLDYVLTHDGEGIERLKLSSML